MFCYFAFILLISLLINIQSCLARPIDGIEFGIEPEIDDVIEYGIEPEIEDGIRVRRSPRTRRIPYVAARPSRSFVFRLGK